MSTTFTPNVKLGQPALGDTGWSTPLNNNCTTLDGLAPVGGLAVSLNRAAVGFAQRRHRRRNVHQPGRDRYGVCRHRVASDDRQLDELPLPDERRHADRQHQRLPRRTDAVLPARRGGRRLEHHHISHRRPGLPAGRRGRLSAAGRRHADRRSEHRPWFDDRDRDRDGDQPEAGLLRQDPGDSSRAAAPRRPAARTRPPNRAC